MKTVLVYTAWLLLLPFVALGFAATCVWGALVAGSMQVGTVIEWLES